MTDDKTVATTARRVSVKHVVAGAAVAVVVVAGLAAASPAEGRRTTPPPARSDSTSAAAAVSQAVADAVNAANQHEPIPADLKPSLAGLAHDRAWVGACDYAVSTHRLCRRGAVRSQRVIVVLGDSHSRVWIPAVEAMAQRTHYAAYYLAKPGCTSSLVTPAHSGKPFTGCVTWRQWALKQIRRMQPTVLVLASELPPALWRPGGGVVRAPARVAPLVERGFVSVIRQARHAGVGRIYLIEDAPALEQSPSDCLAAVGADLGTCASRPSAAADLMSQAEQDAAKATHVDYVETRPWFCALDLCPAVVGSTITHRDTGHLTTVYTRQLNWALQQVMGLRGPS